MIQEIITEELGISNKVSLLTLRIKNTISNDFAKNKNNENFYYNLPIPNIGYIKVYGNTFDIQFENDKLIVMVFIVDKSNEYHGIYIKKYFSEYKSSKKQINLYLTSANGKIDWNLNNNTLQHEVEHYFQSYMKGKPLATMKEIEKYNKFIDMYQNGDMYQKIIGGIYYFYTKVEQNAIMNGLYREIMEINKFSYISKPIEIVQNNNHFKMIAELKSLFTEIENDEMMRDFIIEELEKINKTYKSFERIAKRTFSEYIKKFARTIRKAKKDLEKKYNDVIK